MLKVLQARLQQYLNHKLLDVQTGFRKGRGTSAGSLKKQKSCRKKKNIYFSFIDYAKASDCVDHHKMWRILKEMEYVTTWTASWEISMQVRKQQLELGVEQQTGSK